jgi:hypothetical protein
VSRAVSRNCRMRSLWVRLSSLSATVSCWDYVGCLQFRTIRNRQVSGSSPLVGLFRSQQQNFRTRGQLADSDGQGSVRRRVTTARWVRLQGATDFTKNSTASNGEKMLTVENRHLPSQSRSMSAVAILRQHRAFVASRTAWPGVHCFVPGSRPSVVTSVTCESSLCR